MPLREHLDELRKRLFRAALAVVVGAAAGWWLWPNVVLPLLARPAETIDGVELNFATTLGVLDVQVKGALWVGLIVAAPIWIYQLWAFVTPGLTRKERGYAIGFVLAGFPLFLAGIALAYFILPTTMELITSFTPDGVNNIIDTPNYLSFVMRLLLAFGIAFLLPVLLVALNFAGLVPGRAILKQWRIVVFLCFVFSAIFTPTPDALTMILMAMPLIFLFFVAIGVCLANDKRRARNDDTPDYSKLSDEEASPL
ncbi:twin-arginine translocase subunit TatC [Paenibacillus sp. TRM 82003]|uniref:twin-arginine translocase subunit TatC n=1 Tax=Kineococcus sp. TRM81007 TaxID=2925831 RepID=UPI001F595543|nr:twin-arginine translocase subunit TatC [Kineococcus sp. TRM81007]MCI2237723.1 twin-arginine translocase subunit TatC [Kineococcus sp. TRM81007]MCI3921741.1 twin-arginine translocase subunit TatC [Paenibacillus sp. TRM 82003]